MIMEKMGKPAKTEDKTIEVARWELGYSLGWLVPHGTRRTGKGMNYKVPYYFRLKKLT